MPSAAMSRSIAYTSRAGALLLLAAVLLAFGPPGAARAADHVPPAATGAVFAMTNGLLGNRVTAFERAEDGRLVTAGSYPTGGLGSGIFENNATSLLLGEGSQQSPTDLGGGSRFLFAVNTLSNSITVFERTGATLRRIEIERSSVGNINHPISLTLHGNVLYVLNGPTTNCMAGLPTISGFRVSGGGQLTPIAGSTQPVPGGLISGCSQVSFSPDGKQLIVSERTADNLATYPVDANGVAGPPRRNATAEIGPFGLNFAGDDVLLTAVNNVTLPLLGAAASYKIGEDGALALLGGGAVHNLRSDTCWIEITDDGRYVYTTSFMSGDISSYRVGADGTLTLLKSIAANVDAPIPGAFDLATVGSRFLYALDSNLGIVKGYEIGDDGSLTKLDQHSIRTILGATGLAST